MSQFNLISLPNFILGKLVLSSVSNFSVGDIITGGTSGATAKIRKITVSTKTLLVDNITGIFVDAESVTNTGSGTGTVATSGFDISLSSSGIVKTTVTGSRSRSEVLVAMRTLSSKMVDAATAPTFTAAISYSALSAMVTDDVLTITISASEAVKVADNAYIEVTIGENTRNAVVDAATSTSTSLKFKYTITASDVAAIGEVVVDTTIMGDVWDVVGSSLIDAAVSFVSPDSSEATVNSGSE